MYCVMTLVFICFSSLFFFRFKIGLSEVGYVGVSTTIAYD